LLINAAAAPITGAAVAIANILLNMM